MYIYIHKIYLTCIWNNMNISIYNISCSHRYQCAKKSETNWSRKKLQTSGGSFGSRWALTYMGSPLACISTNRLTSRQSNNLWAIKNHEQVPRILDFSMDPVLSLNAWLLMNMTIVTQVQRQNGDTGYLLNVIKFINFIWTKLQLLSNPNYPNYPNYPNLWNHCFLNGFLYPQG